MSEEREHKRRRRQHHPTEHESHRFVRVRCDGVGEENIPTDSMEAVRPEDVLEIEELPSYGEDIPEVDTASHAPFVHRIRAEPDAPASLGDINVLWNRLNRGKRETERRVGGASSALRHVMEFQFKVKILWALAVGGVATGGGSAIVLIRGLQATAAAEATAEYRLHAAEDLVKDMAPRLRAAEETARILALRIEELARMRTP